MMTKQSSPQNCIFCRILKGELEASFVERGEHCSAFLDIHPINPGHLLIVPHGHFARVKEIPDEVAAALFQMGKRLSMALESSGIRFEGANFMISDGEVAGQEVFHSHLHLIPRFAGDGQRSGFKHASQAGRSFLDELAEQIRSRIK